MNTKRHACQDGGSGLDRRQFIAATGATVAAASLTGSQVLAAPSPKSDAESGVRRLFETLTDEQKAKMALSLDHKNRTRISANWSVTPAAVRSFSEEQQAIITQIFRDATSEDGFERFQKQMKDDWGGFGAYAVAIYGDPSGKEFEFELTGRHHTIRVDGNTKKGVAIGGPVVYGHGAPGNSDKNVFSYQTTMVNQVYEMLDRKQRKEALLANAPRESAVLLRDDVAAIPGIAGSDLSGDQKECLAKSLAAVLQPYRKEDVAEVMEILEAGGGIDAVHVSFYSKGDLGNDKVWDIWRLESPTVVCHFRGSPHVHAYINVARRA